MLNGYAHRSVVFDGISKGADGSIDEICVAEVECSELRVLQQRIRKRCSKSDALCLPDDATSKLNRLRPTVVVGYILEDLEHLGLFGILQLRHHVDVFL